jgi:hypothetical protein
MQFPKFSIRARIIVIRELGRLPLLPIYFARLCSFPTNADKGKWRLAPDLLNHSNDIVGGLCSAVVNICNQFSLRNSAITNESIKIFVTTILCQFKLKSSHYYIRRRRRVERKTGQRPRFPVTLSAATIAFKSVNRECPLGELNHVIFLLNKFMVWYKNWGFVDDGLDLSRKRL